MKIYDREEMNMFYQIRLDRETKKRFMAICKQKGYNSSAIVRNLMLDWIADEENKKGTR
jgi:hypothetical protein